MTDDRSTRTDRSQARTPATPTTRTTACVVGGGPAGVMLGFLLARAGVRVTVLEKHADFLRDFRGDTVHPSTLELLTELGLRERLEQVRHQRISQVCFDRDGQQVTAVDFSHLPVRHPYVALVPQWDFLEMLAAQAGTYPEFDLRRNAEAYELVREDGRVVGVRFRDPDGDHVVRAALTFATDGRHSTIRQASGLRSRTFGAPMDVVWFRLPRKDEDPLEEALTLRLRSGRGVATIPRDTYWQLAYVIRKGGFGALHAQGIEALRRGVAETVPFLADRVDQLAGFEDTSVLEVRVDRLRRWHRPGLLLLGDAAHAMSPLGGVGINLAVQDAVAAANMLTEPLRTAQNLGTPVPERALAAVQHRRQVPTIATQTFQRFVQSVAVAPMLRADPDDHTARMPVPPLVLPLVRRPLGRLIGLGIRPEHVRTRPASVART
ncbi:FAD-dependent oxidoreductase [Actinopolymorpha pittospori]